MKGLKIFANIIAESLSMAWQALVNNKLRSFLSVLGISIGIFSIITVYTLVDSLEQNIRGSLSALGNDVIFVQKWPMEFGNEYPWWKYMNRPTTSLAEFNTLKNQVNRDVTAELAFGMRMNGKLFKYNSNSADNISVAVATHDYDKVVDFEIAKGRYFTENESEAGRNVAVIGWTIAENLFGGDDPIGKDITMGGKHLTVIGVVKKQGESVLGSSFDNSAIIPAHYAARFMETRGDRVDPLIFAKAAPGIQLDEMESDLRQKLRNIRRLKPSDNDNFALNRVTMLSQGITGLFSVITVAGTIIGLFSNLVGGFGIANIMFVSVKERTNIIGIQKALGAKNYFILLQFLIEAIFLCLLGGLMGIILVWPITILTENILHFDIYISMANFIKGVSISLVIGILSGFIPAWSASRLVPVEAIRAKI